MQGIQRADHRRFPNDPTDAETRDRHEPDDHDRSEQTPHAVCAVFLKQEQQEENGDRHRHDVRREERRLDLQALDGAEHADRGCNHAVAVEQRSAEDAERNQHGRRLARRRFSRRGHQRGEREDAAFALVVGAHHDDDVLDGNDDEQRVEHHGQDAEDVLRRHVNRVRAIETLADGVERACADVSVNNAEGGERERSETPGRIRFQLARSAAAPVSSARAGTSTEMIGMRS